MKEECTVVEIGLDSQIVWYAKGWFKKNDVIDDMRKIIAHRNKKSPENITEREIINILAEVVGKYYEIINLKDFVLDIVEHLNPDADKFKFQKKYNYYEAVIEALLFKLTILHITDKDVKIILEPINSQLLSLTGVEV